MEKPKSLLVSALITLLSAVFFSLFMTCLPELVGIALGAAFDSHILREYPRFLPFCLAVGCIAAVLLAVTLRISVRKGCKLPKRARIVSFVAAALLSVPLVAGWSALFDFLQTRL